MFCPKNIQVSPFHKIPIHASNKQTFVRALFNSLVLFKRNEFTFSPPGNRPIDVISFSIDEKLTMLAQKIYQIIFLANPRIYSLLCPSVNL